VNPDLRNTFGGGVGLGNASRVEGDVRETLIPPFTVPIGFTMPQNVEWAVEDHAAITARASPDIKLDFR
jgi:hypothetical protein